MLAAVVAFALGSGGFLSAFLAFLLFAATMALLMLAIGLAVGTSQGTLLRRLRSSTRTVQRVASVVLLFVGAALIASTLAPGTFGALFFPA